MTTSESRYQVWDALADHYLDTETRYLVPSTAWRCLEAGLSPKEAADIWCYEVTPALHFNLMCVAGEWTGWPREWLIERIESRRILFRGPFAYLTYRLFALCIHRSWVAIQRTMELLLRAPPERRRELASDLEWLARWYFDFCGEPSVRDPAALLLLFRDSFLPIFEPLVVFPLERQAILRRRVLTALVSVPVASPT